MEIRTTNLTVIGTRTHRNEHPVFCETTNTIFASSYIAAAHLGIEQPGISMCLTGRKKSTHGYKFSRPAWLDTFVPYVEDAEQRRKAIAEKNELLRPHQENVRKKRLANKLRRLTEQRDELLCKQSAALNEYAEAIAKIDEEIKSVTVKLLRCKVNA